jgi:hypothetical protein
MKKHYTLLTGMIFFLLIKSATAQNLHVSTDSLEIAGGTTVEINGSFITDANTATQNIASILRLTGDFNADPNSSYTSTGTEEFFGPGIQNIYFISGANYLGMVIKNNAGKLFILGNVDCNSFIWTSDGLTDLTSGATLKIKNGSNTAISGYGLLRYFDVDDNMGSIQKLINILNVNYVIPVGNSLAGYRPIVINESSFGVTGAGFITVLLDNALNSGINYSQYFGTGFSGTYPGICTPGPNAQWYQLNCLDRFGWKLRGPSGHVYTLKTKVPPCDPFLSFTSRLVITQEGTPDFTINVPLSVVGSLTDALCLNSNFNNGVDTIPGGPYWFWGDVGNASGDSTTTALPITLMYLTATPQTNSILVQWATASELNNDYFNLQRSTDGINFTTIGWFDGYGTTNQPHQYYYNDKGVEVGVEYYYRLESVEFNGTKDYSKIVHAKLKTALPSFELYPSPTTGNVHCTVFARLVMVTNLMGEKVIEFNNASDFDISGLSSGMYLFEITTPDGLHKTFKIVKK